MPFMSSGSLGLQLVSPLLAVARRKRITSMLCELTLKIYLGFLGLIHELTPATYI
jgi:hypothetical protein